MNFKEHSKISDELLELVYDNLYSIESLNGYCQLNEINGVSAPLVSHIIAKILENQKQILQKTDNYLTEVGHHLIYTNS